MSEAGFMLLLLCVNYNIVMCGAQQNVRDTLLVLYNSILQPNMSRIPPFSEHQSVTNVSLGVATPSILLLDNAEQTLVSSMTFTLLWNDSRMTWKPTHFMNYTFIEIDQAKIWTPVIIIQNAAAGTDVLQSAMPVVTWFYGLCTLSTIGVYKTTCKIDVTKYPFDTQHCVIVLASPFGFPVMLHPFWNKLPDELQIENGEWNITRMDLNVTTLDQSVVAVKIILTMTRRYAYYVINIIFPMALLAVLNSMVFLLPTSSGEKMGFIMTVFMAHAVFLNLIQTSLPTTSDNISRLALYLVLNEIQGFLAIVGAIIVEHRYHNASTDECEKSEVHKCGTWMSCFKRRSKSQIKEADESAQMPQSDDSGNKHGLICLLDQKCRKISDRNLDAGFFIFTLAMAFCNIFILIS